MNECIVIIYIHINIIIITMQRVLCLCVHYIMFAIIIILPHLIHLYIMIAIDCCYIVLFCFMSVPNSYFAIELFYDINL